MDECSPWREGDVIVIDNLAVAHKASPGAYKLDEGLRILHRTTVLTSSGNHDPPPELGRGLHSSTFRLKLSAFCGVGVHLGVVHVVFQRCQGV